MYVITLYFHFVFNFPCYMHNFLSKIKDDRNKESVKEDPIYLRAIDGFKTPLKFSICTKRRTKVYLEN